MSVPSLGQIFTAQNLIGLALLIVAFTLHELSHGVVAYSLGDDTGKKQGRLTLNPWVHIDLFMTVLLPFMILVSTGGAGWFGGAKPMPVVTENFKKPRRDLAIVAAAGPLSNWILALFATMLGAVLIRLGWMASRGFWPRAFEQFLTLNLFLVALNLLPIPPLDGYKVMRIFLPKTVTHKLDRLDWLGVMIVLLLLVSSWTQGWIFRYSRSLEPSVRWVERVINPQ